MATSATPVTEKPAGTRSVEAGLLSVETGPRSIPKIEFIVSENIVERRRVVLLLNTTEDALLNTKNLRW